MKLLEDASGVYLLASIASIHPVPIKGEARDQSKVTEVHTLITTAGGHRHNTAIPYDKALQTFKEFHAEPANPQA